MATETKERFADVKVGDRVWANSGVNWAHGKDQLKTVVKTSPAFIYLEGHAEYNTFKRNGRAYGRFMAGGISRLATPEECAEWDREQSREAAERQSAEDIKTRREALRAELRELFSTDSEANMVYVTDAEWTAQRNEGKFDVKIHGLTEVEVRELANKIQPVSR